jgi:ribonuclease P protein component
MLPRNQRLRANQDFQRVYRGGKSWAHPLMALNLLPQPGGQRVGISVSKKVGKAVERNRARRRIRELVRARLPGWRDGFDAVIVARAGSAEAPFSELGEALQELARRARLPRELSGDPDAPYTLPESGRPGTTSRKRRGPAGQGEEAR